MACMYLFLALQPQPAGGADELLVLAPGRHRKVRVRRAQFGVDLTVDGFDNTLVHRKNPRRPMRIRDSSPGVWPAVNPVSLSIRSQFRGRAEPGRGIRTDRLRYTFSGPVSPAPLLPPLLLDAPIAVASFDLEGRVVDANRALLRGGGYTIEELRGRPFAEFLDPESAADALARFEALASGAVEVYRTERRYRARGGEMREVDLTISLVRDENGRPAGGLAVLQDVTGLQDRASRIGAPGRRARGGHSKHSRRGVYQRRARESKSRTSPVSLSSASGPSGRWPAASTWSPSGCSFAIRAPGSQSRMNVEASSGRWAASASNPRCC